MNLKKWFDIQGRTVGGSMGAVDPPFEKSALFEKKK